MQLLNSHSLVGCVRTFNMTDSKYLDNTLSLNPINCEITGYNDQKSKTYLLIRHSCVT